MGRKGKRGVRVLDEHNDLCDQEVEQPRSATKAEEASNQKSVDSQAEEATETIVDLGLDISTSVTGDPSGAFWRALLHGSYSLDLEEVHEPF